MLYEVWRMTNEVQSLLLIGVLGCKKEAARTKLDHVQGWSRATSGMLSMIGQNVLGRDHVNKSANS